MGVISRVLLYISCFFIGLIVLITGIEMVGRKLPTGSPIAGSYELGALMLFIVFHTAFSHTEVVNRHIEVDSITSRLPRSVRDIVVATMLLIVVVFSALSAWSLIQFGIFLTISGKVIQTYPILTGPLYVFGGLCWILFMMLSLGRLLILLGDAVKSQAVIANTDTDVITGGV